MHRKAISYIVGFALILGLSISAIAIVYAVVIPQIQLKQAEASILDAINTLKLLDNKIDVLMSQGSNSSTILTLNVPRGIFKISPTSGYDAEILYRPSGARNQTIYSGSLGRLTYNTSYTGRLVGENDYRILYGSKYHYVKSDSLERENAQIIESQKGSTVIIGLKYRVVFHIYERDVDGDGDNDYDVLFLLIKLTTDTGADINFLGNRKLFVKNAGTQTVDVIEETRTSTFYIRGWDADQNGNFDEEIATVTLSTGQILRITILQVNIVIGVQ
jgi:hypothetical protein